MKYLKWAAFGLFALAAGSGIAYLIMLVIFAILDA